MKPEKKLKLGVIGGDLSLRAALVFHNYPKEKSAITAVADRDPAILDDIPARLPELSDIPRTESADELIASNEVEAVFIMVRDEYHEELAVKSLNAGKSVYLEKPMAISIKACDNILETAYRTKSKLFVGHNMRYSPFVRKMKEIIDSGLIGAIHTVWCRHFVAYGSCYFRHWCAERKNCTGLLLQKGCHDIDVIQWLAGAAPKYVTAMGRLSVYNQTRGRLENGEKPDRKISFTPEAWPPIELTGLSPRMDVEDSNMILMQMENGVQASYLHCMYTPDSERNYTFIGTNGRMENIGDGGPGTQIHVWTQRGKRSRPDIIHSIGGTEGGHGGADLNIVESFVDFVREEKPVPVTPLDARYAVAAGCMGHESMRNGCMPQAIPPVAEHLERYFLNGQKT